MHIKNLTKVYKNKRGVFDITFAIEKGEVYGLLGPNGAGKTTSLKLLMGLISKDGGDAEIEGKTLSTHPIEYRRDVVGMIGNTVLYDYLTPLDHLSMMRVHYDSINEEAMEKVLEEMDLLDYKNEKVKQFSTGMKQRLAFAMCIVHKPRVLLLDEPFSGLDIEGKLLVRQKICELRDAGNIAIIISSHLIHDLEEVATKVGIMKEGYLIDEQELKTVQENYKNMEAYFIAQTMKVKEGA